MSRVTGGRIVCTRFPGEGIIEVPRHRLVFRPSVYALIVRNNHLLMVRGRLHGKLFFPGGGIEPGELGAMALKREVLEETGREICNPRLWEYRENFIYDELDRTAYHYLLFFYSADLVGDGMELNGGDPDEGEPEWVPLADERADLQDIAPYVIRDYLAWSR